VDVFVWTLAQNSRLFRNEARDANHWLEAKLVGATANRGAIGATVRATAGGITQLRQVTGGDGAHSQSEPIVHLGVGEATAVDLEIVWPGGEVQILPEVPVDRLIFVDQAAGLLAEEIRSSSATWSAGVLSIAVESSFGGRTGFSTVYGELPWDPDLRRFTASYLRAEEVAEIEIANRYGETWLLPVL